MNIQFLVTDPLGRRTGYEPDSSKRLIEIPSSHYSLQAIGSYDGHAEIESREFGAAFGSEDTLVNGTYTISIVGMNEGSYYLDVDIEREDLKMFHLSGQITKGERRLYRLKYNSDPSIPLEMDSTSAH